MNHAHKDPTFNLAYALEVQEKNCTVCQRNFTLNNKNYCSNGLKFPSCRQKRNGFKVLDQ